MNHQINISNARLELQKLFTTKNNLKAPIYTNEKVLEIWLDAAHGEDVAGKRSPDGKHREYLWSRMIIERLSKELEKLNYVVKQTNETTKEIGLMNRVNVVKSSNHKYKTLLSIHNDAAPAKGDGWSDATGISFYTSKGLSVSDVFAECLLYASEEVKFSDTYHRKNIRTESSNLEQDFTVIYSKDYYSVLAEILFQNNKKDVERLNDINFQNSCIHMFIIGIEMFNTFIFNSIK